jgi:hypothetical protein
VRKILIFLAPMVLMAIVYGCSKDHTSPTFSKYTSILKQPTGFVAVYNKTTKMIDMNWDMPDTNSVITYNVTWSDSNVFDFGKVMDKYSQSLNKTYSISASEALKSMGYTAHYDSFIVYFAVSAVYSNSQFRDFSGPRSVVDSALVLDYTSK